MLEEEKNEKTQQKESLLNALEQDFAASVNRIYINSLDKEYDFREITVLEQKQLSRILIDNEGKNRKDVVFEAQCALVQKICMNDDFNIWKIAEFDRLKLMMVIYQQNVFKSDVNFVCDECGTENAYKLDFDNVIEKLDKIDVSPKHKLYENKKHKFDFTIAYPKVEKVKQFYREYNKKYKGVNKYNAKSLDNAENFEYLNLYIEKIEYVNKATGKKTEIDIAQYPIDEAAMYIEKFPQDVLYSEDGVMSFIVNEFVGAVNNAFDKQVCWKCGAEHKEVVGSVNSFL